MKRAGLSYEEVQALFMHAGLPSSRSSVTRALRSAGIEPRRITYKTVRFDSPPILRLLKSTLNGNNHQ